MTDRVWSRFHPVLHGWFSKRYGQATLLQRQAWANIASGKHVLIASPTGSGKTLAALLPCLNQLQIPVMAITSDLPRQAMLTDVPGVRVLYITPLKALNNDVLEHLQVYLEEMAKLSTSLGVPWRAIRAAVRTGDTSQSERSAMLRRPPEVLITTPESLFILLTSHKGCDMLRTVTHVIVDEIHDLASSRRGAHLSLSLERLESLFRGPIQRIGVSATQNPIAAIAQYLGGWQAPEAPQGPEAPEAPRSRESDSHRFRPREVRVVEHLGDKALALRVVMPRHEDEPATSRNDWMPVIREISRLLEGRRTAIVFANNRRLCERLTLRLNDNAGYEIARAHHGSVSREQRLEAERMLRDGQLRCIVATSSLELGIDVGHIDLVIQVDSPKDAASGIQRIGRAGHHIDGVSEGVLVARNRSELGEIAVLSERIRNRIIEPITIPRLCLDVLAQHIVSMVATKDWTVSEISHLIRHSDSFHSLPDSDYEGVLKILSGYFPFARPLIDWNRTTNVLIRRSNTAMAALMGAGTIPQSGGYPVIHQANKIQLGELDEEFVSESRVGDVFQLGTSSWMIRSIRHNAVYVVESANPYSEIPFWKGGALGISRTIGAEVGALYGRIAASDTRDAAAWLEDVYHFDEPAARSLATLVDEQHRTCAVPTARQVVLERFTDDIGQVHLIIHSIFGRRFNRTWMLALERVFEQHATTHIYAYAKDNGIQFVFSTWDPKYLESFWSITEQTIEPMLVDALTASAQFAITFRRLAETGLLLTRSFRRTPTWQRRLRGEALLRQSLPYAAEFPLIKSAMRECIEEWFDLDGVRDILERIAQGEIAVIQRDTVIPSPMARLFLAEFAEEKLYEGDVLQVQIQAGLASVTRSFGTSLFGESSPSALHPFDEDVWEAERIRTEGDDKVIASPLQLVDWLKQRGDATREELSDHVRIGDLDTWLSSLISEGRVATLGIGGEERFICRDEVEVYSAMFAGVPGRDGLANVGAASEEANGGTPAAVGPANSEASGGAHAGGLAIDFVLRRFVQTQLTFTREDVVARYGELRNLSETLERWLADGVIVCHGETPHSAVSDVYMSREALERIQRAAIQKGRSQVTAEDAKPYVRHLLMTHHLTSRRTLVGTDGLRQIIDELQGLFLPASFWESIVFPARMVRYRKEDLDLLCASGEVIWLAQRLESSTKEPAIAFFLAKSTELYAPLVARCGKARHPELLLELRRKGASFLAGLGGGTATPPSQLLDQLLELAWEGFVSNDQFAPIRHSLTPQAQGKLMRAATGRWYVLESLISDAPPPEQCAIGWAKQLLRLHGILAKPAVKEGVPYSWDTLRVALEKFEEWGHVTRGLFLRDVPYIQFASRETASSLAHDAVHAARRSDGSRRDEGGDSFPAGSVGGCRQDGGDWQSGGSRQDAGDRKSGSPAQGEELVVLSAIDPANPYGSLLPWPKQDGASFARRPGNFLVIRDGRWLLWIEANGRRMVEIREDSRVGDGATGLLRTHSGDPICGSEASHRGSVASPCGSVDCRRRSETSYHGGAGMELSAILEPVCRTLFSQYGARKLKMATWNGEPILDTPVADVLRGLGAVGDKDSVVLWSINMKRAGSIS